MSDFHVVIVGAGLVGALAAISFARQGYTVSLYDARPDPRLSQNAVGRSINLAVSARGLGAITSIDPALCERIQRDSIPMKGRMIHAAGKQQSQLYGLFGECINSIDRSKLNIELLNEAESYKSVTLQFGHKLLSVDFEARCLTFRTEAEGQVSTSTGTTKIVHSDLTVGCDGAFSAVRSAMMKAQRMDFTQEYIEHAYLELAISPTSCGGCKLDPGHLHIWPRQEFMLIALPNPDNSFTSTLFAPYSLFDSLKTSQSIIHFFREQFPDALEMIGDQNLLKMWANNPIAPLIQIQCSPYHFKDRAILLGDSTHAMVPFYGQGMNCGFEDIRVLNEIMKDHGVTPQASCKLQSALEQYSRSRHDDLRAILKLAMANYVEMRSSVTSKLYLFRKHIDGMLGRLLKNQWVPMYSMVSFRDDIPYTTVVSRQRRQTRIVNLLLSALASGIGTYMMALIVRKTRFGNLRTLVRRGLLLLLDSMS